MWLEDARQELDLAHQRAILIHEDRGAIPAADGCYAHGNALRAEIAAVKNYLGALQDFKAALALEQVPTGVEEPVDGTRLVDAAITPRERQVLALIAAGKSSKQIAAQLGVAFRTAVCHRYRLYQKLNVHTNVELTRAAMRMGLIEL